VGIGTTLLLFLTQNNSNSSLAVQKTRPIRIADSGGWAGGAPLDLAAYKFFKENNVLVQLILTGNQTKSEELYLKGSVDGIASVYTDTIFHNSEGVNSRLVWILD
jgi:hypothetical protein